MSKKSSRKQRKKSQATNIADVAVLPKAHSPEQAESFEEAFRRGTQLLHKGQAAEAVPYLEQAYFIQPDSTDTAINLGGAYILTKKFGKAVAVLEPASQNQADSAQIWINLGAAYLGNPILAGDDDQLKAISAFERALEINPTAPSVAYNIGLVYRDRKEVDKAIHWFRQAIKHNPGDRDARSLLSQLESK